MKKLSNKFPWDCVNDRVLIKPVERDLISKGGIHIAETAMDFNKAIKGEVVAVGPGRYDISGQHIPMSVSVGDVVYYDRTCGVDIEFSRDVKMKVVRDPEIILIELNPNQ